MTSVPLLRCATAAEQRGDPPWGTASPVQRWFLVEQPGPWGRDAARASRLDRSVAEELLARCRAADVRVLLIRRSGRVPTGPRRWGIVDSRAGQERSWWGTVDRDEELLTLPLDGSAGAPSGGPTYLVCTHGRHDACCAIRGRPVAAALTALRPEATWECSHVGGDRFAANLVVLPHGLYYGHVTPATASAVVTAYEAGTVVPAWLRGRCIYPGPVQAAQHHARLLFDERAVDALAPVRADLLDAATWRVRLAAASGPVDVVVAVEEAASARLTCAATRDATTRSYRLVSLSAVEP